MHSLKRIAALADNEITPSPSKTLVSMLRYRSDRLVTIVDRDNAGVDAGSVLAGGLGRDLPIVPDVAAALEFQPDALLLADEPVGAAIQPYWRGQVLVALERGLDVISGLHYQLSEDDEVRTAAERSGATIWDLRRPPTDRYFTEFGVDGRPIVEYRAHRPGSRTVLAVGTDCGCGKMTTMLELDREARARGVDSTFVATGQVGMMVSGGGIAVDSIMADFVNSVVEDVVYSAARRHDLVLVEGQGAVNHPRYSAVTLGLVHGSRPDTMILCHDLGRTAIGLLRDRPLPSLRRAVEINEEAIRWADQDSTCRVAGISVMTRGFSAADARAALTAIAEETGLPTVDVLRDGAGALLDAVEVQPAA